MDYIKLNVELNINLNRDIIFTISNNVTNKRIVFLGSKIKKRFIKLIFTETVKGEINNIYLHVFKSEYGYRHKKFKVIMPEFEKK